MDLRLFYGVLGVSSTCPKEELRVAFHEWALHNHPDHGGDGKLFEEIIGVYKKQLLVHVAYAGYREEGVAKTRDGTPLSELGKGLRVNGKTCPRCAGKGYEELPDWMATGSWETCMECRGTGGVLDKSPCGRCKGTGKYHGGKCFQCDGSGLFTLHVPCPKCNPRGWGWGREFNDLDSWLFGIRVGQVWVPYAKEMHFVRCTTCKGTGELEMFNPVLRKWTLKG